MALKKFFLLIVIFGCFEAAAQKISGVVMDSISNKRLAFATVTAKNSDGELVNGTITNDDGEFQLNMKNPAAILEVQYIGFSIKTMAIPSNNKEKITILLTPTDRNLDAVTVEGERTSREFMIDRKVINLGEDMQSAGQSMLEAFEQLPEVQTNPGTGEISLRGNSNVKILINGKPSPLNNQDLLEQIDASQVEQVEIITSPSAKYQADGMAGIINIVLADKIIKGFSGSVQVDGRSNPGYGTSLNLIGGFGQFNLQGRMNYRNNFFLNKNSSRRLFADGLSQVTYANREFSGDVLSGNFKMDWFINERNDLSLTVNLTNNEHTIDSETDIQSSSADEDIMNFLTNYHLHETQTYNLNHQTRLNEKGTATLTTDVNLNLNENTLPNTSYTNGMVVADNQLFFNNKILNASMDLELPLNEKLKLESGFLYTSKNIDNQQISRLQSDLRTLQYGYDETTYAGYALIRKDQGKFDLQLGLRAEYFLSDGRIEERADPVSREFFNIFPSFHMSYKASEISSFSFGYNRRISRPSFFHLNPLTTINNPFFRREGNPFLTPAFTDNMEVGYQLNNQKWSINTSLYYRYMSDLINRNFFTDQEVTVMTFQNGGYSQIIGNEITFNYDVSQKINATLTTAVNYEQANPNVDNFFFEDQYSYNTRLNVKYKISKKLSSDFQFMYFGKNRSLNMIMNDRNLLNVAVRYKAFNNRGTFTLRVTDIYRGNIFKTERFSDDIVENMKWIGQTRVATLSFVYRFRKGKIKNRSARSKNYNESGALE